MTMTINDIYLQERYHQEDLQRLRDFRPIDDTFMRCLFRDNLPLAQFVLRINLSMIGNTSCTSTVNITGTMRWAD